MHSIGLFEDRQKLSELVDRAVYLDLARQEKLPLASLDEWLRAAAPPAGVALLR